jgi:hypothetical protein
MHKEKAKSERSKFSDEQAVQVLHNVKEYGRGEVVFKISDGEIRKIDEIKRY